MFYTRTLPALPFNQALTILSFAAEMNISKLLNNDAVALKYKVAANDITETASSVICHACTIQPNYPVKVVLKVVLDDKLANNEITVLRALSCVPRVERLQDSFKVYGINVLVFPTLEPVTFTRLDMVQAADFMRQLCVILSGVHSKGFAHLDISPSNIMKDGNNLVIIDWALARYIQLT
jgi:serine/threonine protein kinase